MIKRKTNDVETTLTISVRTPAGSVSENVWPGRGPETNIF